MAAPNVINVNDVKTLQATLQAFCTDNAGDLYSANNEATLKGAVANIYQFIKRDPASINMNDIDAITEFPKSLKSYIEAKNFNSLHELSAKTLDRQFEQKITKHLDKLTNSVLLIETTEALVNFYRDHGDDLADLKESLDRVKCQEVVGIHNRFKRMRDALMELQDQSVNPALLLKHKLENGGDARELLTDAKEIITRAARVMNAFPSIRIEQRELTGFNTEDKNMTQAMLVDFERNVAPKIGRLANKITETPAMGI